MEIVKGKRLGSLGRALLSLLVGGLGVLCFRIQLKIVIFSGFGVLFECISKGFPIILDQKILKIFRLRRTG